jgi:hypothetical protein
MNVNKVYSTKWDNALQFIKSQNASAYLMKVCSWMDDVSDTANKGISDEESDSSYWGPHTDDDEVYDLGHGNWATATILQRRRSEKSIVHRRREPKKDVAKEIMASRRKVDVVSAVTIKSTVHFENFRLSASTRLMSGICTLLFISPIVDLCYGSMVDSSHSISQFRFNLLRISFDMSW